MPNIFKFCRFDAKSSQRNWENDSNWSGGFDSAPQSWQTDCNRTWNEKMLKTLTMGERFKTTSIKCKRTFLNYYSRGSYQK